MEKRKIDPVNRKLVFVDTETTGLDPTKDKIVELSYVVDTSPIETLYFGVIEVSDFIDNLIKFSERGISGFQSSTDKISWFTDEILNGNTMVGANPAFDRGFMEANNLYTAGYRMLDIESYAMAKLGLSWVPGMDDIYKILTDNGHKIPKNEHSSASDVDCMRHAFWILEDL